MKNRIIAAGVIAASILSYSSSSFAQIKNFQMSQLNIGQKTLFTI